MSITPFVLIMAGGTGSRFWPASRESEPKQFLDITGSGRSLIQMTFERLAAFIPSEKIYVITHENYRRQTLEALPGLDPSHIITEPSRNNTAASIAYASLKLSQNNSEAVCIVAPADHIIHDEQEFQRVIGLATNHAEIHNSIVTLGITPTRPDTGYGYIEFEKSDTAEIRKVRSFREKPTPLKAGEYLHAGNFAWNSGLFIWKLKTIIDAFKAHSPQIYDTLIKGQELFNTESEILFIQSVYPKTENISVDYAILERADNVYTIPCDIGWSDLGTWNSLYDYSHKDDQRNAFLSSKVYSESTTGTLVLSNPDKLIVCKGLEDFIIIDTDDCLLIYPRKEEQEIKTLKERLKKNGLEDYL